MVGRNGTDERYTAFYAEEDREEIDDIVFEFEAQQDTGIELDVQVYVSNDSLSTFHDVAPNRLC
ncbi:hypothetical protein PN36_34445 [Candidatus Thiomargarita nelsonii]|uniref:Uncharacterized protein n=1 Tax=Candidatus Thiomargarita nelsonii TaxID=1003181 RepID=A0A4E0RCH5_9GAMM|nr:hypothetical protein PN36_34445 [Candidatus Thiomargarita nelsonii]